MMALLEEFFIDLPQQGPGSDDETIAAFRRLPPLPPRPRVLDAGCGTGRTTLCLGRLLDGTVDAVDLMEGFVASLQRRVEAAGLTERIRPRVGDMAALPFPDGTFDLVWCEGAAYSVGFETALASFHRVLAPSGLAVVTEAAWLVPDPPPEARALWDREYGAIADEATLRRRCEDGGFRVLDARPLPGSCWSEDYYAPILRAIPRQRKLWAPDPEALALLDGLADEAATYRRVGHTYGYLVLILRKESAS